MARIDPRLLQALRKKLHLEQAQIYKRITAVANAKMLDRRLAAMALAAEQGLNIAKYATPEDWAQLRGGGTLPPSSAVSTVLPTKLRSASKPVKKTTPERRGNTVFVVHGRNEKLRQGLFAFLRSLGLHPLEWGQALSLTKKGSPYVGEILDTAFSKAVAIVVLLSPDDEARLKKEFQNNHDELYEKQLTGQARPNVLFEAGMAFGKNPDSTVLVQVGSLRPFSDVGGRHAVRLSNDAQTRREFVTKLANAGCNVDTSGSDWLTEGDFSV